MVWLSTSSASFHPFPIPMSTPSTNSEFSDPPPQVTNPSEGRAASLATEVLGNIFFFIQQYPDENGAWFPTHLQSASQICRHWRTVILGRHRLWTDIQVTADAKSVDRFAKSAGLVETFLHRSRPVLPLTIKMVVDPYNVWSTMSLNADPENAEDRLTKNKLAAASMYRYIR